MARLHVASRNLLEIEDGERFGGTFDETHAVSHDAGKNARPDFLSVAFVLEKSGDPAGGRHVRARGDKLQKLSACIGRAIGCHGDFSSGWKCHRSSREREL